MSGNHLPQAYVEDLPHGENQSPEVLLRYRGVRHLPGPGYVGLKDSHGLVDIMTTYRGYLVRRCPSLSQADHGNAGEVHVLEISVRQPGRQGGLTPSGAKRPLGPRPPQRIGQDVR